MVVYVAAASVLHNTLCCFTELILLQSTAVVEWNKKHITSNGESKPERTGTFRGPVETKESVPGPQNVNIRTGTVVPGPGPNDAVSNYVQLLFLWPWPHAEP